MLSALGRIQYGFNNGSGSFGPAQKLTDAFGFHGGEWALQIRRFATLRTFTLQLSSNCDTISVQ